MRRYWLILIAALGLFSASLRAQTPDPVNLTAIWYDTSAQGYGVNVVHQGSILFVAWYTYGADGKVLWLLSAATRQPDGHYTGQINTFNGQPFSQINAAQAWTATQVVGSTNLSLGTDGKLDFGYTLNGITQAKRLEKLSFVANPPTCGFTTASRATATNYTDVWWNSTESGWGLSMIHQGDSIFIAWYTYDGQGKPQWITGLASRLPAGVYAGMLNRPLSGTPFNQITSGAATTFPLPAVGSFRLSFSDGEHVSFEYTLDNISQTKALSRYVYVAPGTPVTLCTAAPTTPTALTACDPGLNAGDFRTSLSDASGATEVTERVIGPGTFQGQSVIVVENYDAQNVMNNRYYMQVTPTEILTLGNDAFQNGQVVLSTVFNPPSHFTRFPAIGQSYTQNYVGTNTGSGLNYTVQYQETIQREADEPEDTPAGSFDTCKFKRNLTFTTFGVGSSIEMDLWQTPLIGNVRSKNRVAGPQGTTNVQIDLLRARINGISYPH
jgi:hypothetical protein